MSLCAYVVKKRRGKQLHFHKKNGRKPGAKFPKKAVNLPLKLFSENMVTLRPITVSDVEIFSKTASRAFVEAYRETETMEELEVFCSKHFNLEQLTADLQNIDYQHIAAFLGDEMVGYLKLNLAVRPDGSRDILALQIHRIYLLRDFWAHKIGAALMLKSMEIAREIGASHLWLVVYNKNQRAQDFYKKWGFEQTGIFDFDFNGAIHKDYIFELELPPNP